VLHPVGQLDLIPGAHHDLAVDTSRRAASVDLRHPPHAKLARRRESGASVSADCEPSSGPQPAMPRRSVAIPGWNADPWASTSGFAPAVTHDATPRRERSLRTGPGTTPSTSIEPPPASSTHLKRPRVAQPTSHPATRLDPAEPARNQRHHRIQRCDPPSKIHHAVIIAAGQAQPLTTRRSAVAVLTGLRPSPTSHAVVGFRF
jgi:hypothetical protein